MSKKNNGNPTRYKTKGRDPQGQDVIQKIQKEQFAEQRARTHQETAPPIFHHPPAPDRTSTGTEAEERDEERKSA